MKMTDAELIVLANLVSFPEHAFEVVGGLHLRPDDFSEASHRAAFAELVRLGPASSEKLLMAVSDALPTLKTNAKAMDAFLALAPSLAEVEHHICAFAEGVARAKMQKDLLALMSDGTLPADLLSKEVDRVKDEFEARLRDIGRVRGSFVPDDGGDFDGAVPTPVELMDVPGFVNILADYTYRTAPRYNRVLAFAGALSMISCLAGRKFTDRRRTMPNLYLVALAGSGCGKDHPRKVNKRLAVAVNSGSVADQIASGQGLEDALLTNPVRLFEMDEFDTLLNELKEKSALSEGMMKYLLNFFSESGSFHTMRKKALTDRERELLASGATTGGDVVIPYPSLSLFATAVPEYFYKALSLRSLTNGLLARCLVFEAGRREPRGEGPFDLPFPDEVLQTAQMLVGRTEEKDWQQKPRLAVVPDDEGVDAALKAIRKEEDRLYAACERNNDEAGMAIWSRGVELASKLALLYAVSENPAIPRISVRGVEWSWKLVKYSAGRMLKMAEAYVADDKEDADAQMVLRFLQPYKSKGAMHSQISHKLHLSRKRMDEAIATLLERDAIEKWTGKGGATYYRAKKGGGEMKKKRKYDLFEMMDECLMRKDAERQHRATYLEGLQKLCVAVTPTGVDIGFIQRFFGDRVADFDAGVVQTYDYPIWKTIGYLLSFDMDFAYAFLNTESGQDPDVNRDLVGMSEYMEREYQQQKVAAEAFKAYLTAAGALARRIGSSTYEAWRGLLMEAEFTDRYGTAMFEDVSAFDSFLSKMNVELRRLWADVKIRSHETIAQTPPTHPRGRAKN